jgi:lipid-A-disaccharide synthase
MIKPYFLHVKYISLVNLILDRELVRELIGDEVNPEMIQRELSRIVKNGDNREEMLRGYEEMTQRLGPAGAPVRAAETMCDLLKS